MEGSPSWIEFYIAIAFFGLTVIAAVKIMLIQMNKRLDKQIAEFKIEAHVHWTNMEKSRGTNNAASITDMG